MEQLNEQQNSNCQLDYRKTTDQFKTNNKSNQVSNSKVCSFYSTYGFCKFGQNCKFLHRRKYYSYKNPGQRKPEFPKNDVSLKTHQKVEKNSARYDYNSNKTLTEKNPRNRMCKYFKEGLCSKGENCLYNHIVDGYNFNTDMIVPKNIKSHLTKGIKTIVSKKRSIPICRYFSRGSCQKGDQCKFYHNIRNQKDCINAVFNSNENGLSDHQANDDDVSNQKNTEYVTVVPCQSNTVNSRSAESLPSCSKLLTNNENSKVLPEFKELNTSQDVTTNNHIKIRFQIPQNSRIFNLKTLSEDSLYELRNTEINQLKRRFPKLEEKGSSFTFDFEPTDPDWPFDTKSLHIQAIFPESYPLEACKISIVSHMSYVPGVLIRHLNQSICNWIAEKHKAAIEQDQVILLFRPFLKWFDKNLEELFKFGLKKVTEDEPQNVIHESTVPEKNSPEPCEKNLENYLSKEESALSSNNAEIPEDAEKENGNSLPKQEIEPTIPNNLQMQGSKIIFTGLELIEGVAALSCKKLAATVHCSRCKTSCNKILVPNKNTPMMCSKCSKNMECNFNPSILHQFSSVLGTLYLMECQAVDVNLVECAFLLDCLSCSKQVPVDGLHYGQKQKLWCKFCNQKLILGIEGVKFQATVPSTVAASNKTVAVKKVTKIKDPVIKEGCPLPDYGTCKHYKKSYRWLRFPCCGRLYPCDLCHDEKEENHDMKYASRMVCGFCSKEQPYSKEKPCFGCSSNMTKKSGSYWEGGQGCRNSVTMSRKDVHKYAGMSKTISKKSQPTGKKKK